MSGASGGRNQHFYQGMIFAFGLQGRRPRPAVRGGAVLPFPQAGEPVLESIPLSYQALGGITHHLLSFCSQVTPSSPWGSGCLEGPKPCVNKGETWWDGIKTALFCVQENTGLSDASPFFHPCCHAGFSPKPPGTVPMAPPGEQDEIGV